MSVSQGARPLLLAGLAEDTSPAFFGSLLKGVGACQHKLGTLSWAHFL